MKIDKDLIFTAIFVFLFGVALCALNFFIKVQILKQAFNGGM